jgi:hypothetical protein
MRCKTSAALTAAIAVAAALLYAAPAFVEAAGEAAPPAPSGRADPNSPTAPIVQLQIQDWYNTRLSGIDGQSNLLLIRPVLPLPLSARGPGPLAGNK